MNLKHFMISAAVAGLCATTVSAQTITVPQFIDPNPTGSVVPSNMSNNGKWMLTNDTYEDGQGQVYNTGGSIYNLDNIRQITPVEAPSGRADLADISNDGNIVVGSYNGSPAYYNVQTKTWKTLKLPLATRGGQLTAVTPDGKYAVGVVFPSTDQNGMAFKPVMYDLTTEERISFPNLPNIDMTGLNQGQNQFIDVTPDGRYVLGIISYSYILPVAPCTYVYDRQTDTYDFIGFNVENYNPTQEGDGAKWKPLVSGISSISGGSLSPDGEWITGSAYMVKDVAGSQFGDEYDVAYRYNIKDKSFLVYDSANENDYSGFSVSNDGFVYAASPAGNPYSTAYIHVGKHYVSFDEIFKQKFNYDFLGSQNKWAVTGKPILISEDAKTIVMMPSHESCYILKVPQPLHEVSADINLLSSYTVSPAQNAQFSRLTTVTLSFTRPIAAVGAARRITLTDQDGNQVAQGLQVNATGVTATVGFRTVTLDPGKTYTITIPAGTFAMSNDNNMKSPEIKVSYTGRRAGAVKMTAASPADGSSMSRLDMTTSPVTLTFDANIALGDTHTGSLYHIEDGKDVFVSDINMLAGTTTATANQLLVYPTEGRYLYKGYEYKLVIDAGSVTDISGQGANEEIVLHYNGTYVREVSSDDINIYTNPCNNWNDIFAYEGDHNNPSSAMVSLGFQNGDEYPWWVCFNDDRTNSFYASHSMYNPVGKSNDWLFTPQLFIPDASCVLSFDVQSYLKGYEDRLKVYVLATDGIIDNFNSQAVADRFLNEGTLIFNSVLSPGESEGGVDGEWQHVSYPLTDFAGKSIYVAFLNDNENQSMVFLDNIEIKRDVKFLVTFNTASRMVKAASTPVSGNVTIASETTTYSDVTLVLRDSKNNEIDRITESGLNLKRGDVYNFAFNKPMPLVEGESNEYIVDVTMGEDKASERGVVKNLLFEPVQNIVIEKFTGQGCPNCPRGIVGIEHIENVYGKDRIFPIGIYTYTGDAWGMGLTDYSNYLGLGAAPSGRVNRGDITDFLAVVDGHYQYSGEGTSDGPQALDYVVREFAAGTDSEISATADQLGNDGSFNVNVSVKSAVNLNYQDLRVFGVITEDNLEGYQSNNYYSATDDIMKDWCMGGKYATGTVWPYYHNDVARVLLTASPAGTPDIVPGTVKAGEEYKGTLSGKLPGTIVNLSNLKATVMLVDANTGKIVNSARIQLEAPAGIEGVAVDGRDAANVTVLPSAVKVDCAGEFSVQIYNMSGMMVASAAGSDSIQLSTAGFNGPAVIRVVSASGSKAVKAILR